VMLVMQVRIKPQLEVPIVQCVTSALIQDRVDCLCVLHAVLVTMHLKMEVLSVRLVPKAQVNLKMLNLNVSLVWLAVMLAWKAYHHVLHVQKVSMWLVLVLKVVYTVTMVTTKLPSTVQVVSNVLLAHSLDRKDYLLVPHAILVDTQMRLG
jgi:hypothetical protein